MEPGCFFDEGTFTDALGPKCDFREAVVFLTRNLGTGQVKRKMGFGMELEGGGQDARATVEEAIRRHLLTGKITAGQTIRLEANGDRIQFRRNPARLVP